LNHAENLIASTDIATVFVDRAMRIKRYTAPAVGLFNLIKSDVGRPLLDLTHRLEYPELADDAAAVFSRLQMIEREVETNVGHSFLARLLPYRTADHHIDGAVFTQPADISVIHRRDVLLRRPQEIPHNMPFGNRKNNPD
jgi:two-component system CheB/CheR fusion protein